MNRGNGDSITDCKNCTTKNCFVKLCNEEWLISLGEIKRTSLYKKGQYIVTEGNPVDGLYFIKQGRAKVFSTGINQKSQVVRLTTEGDIIGHRGYGGDVYPISSIVLEDSIVCFIDNNNIYDAFLNNPHLCFELMMYYSKELRNSEAKIKTLAQMNVREKVAEALLYSKRLYKPNEHGHLNIKLGRKDLADLAGINTEQLSRTLSELQHDKVLFIRNKHIVIEHVVLLEEIVSPY